jgi:hypothetical protein
VLIFNIFLLAYEGGMGGKCVEIDVFPNATVAEYGGYSMFSFNKVHKIKAEIFARGKFFTFTFVGGMIRMTYSLSSLLILNIQDLLLPVSMLNHLLITREGLSKTGIFYTNWLTTS